MMIFMKKVGEKFGGFGKSSYLCIAIKKQHSCQA